MAQWDHPPAPTPPTHTHTPMYTSQGTLWHDALAIVMCPLKHLVTEVAWSGGVFSAAQMLLNDHRL